MSEAKKNKKKLEKTKKQAIKSTYLIGIGAVLIVVCLFVLISGFLPSQDNKPSEKKTLMLFGLLDSSQSDEAQEEHVLSFIAQNAGISDACEIAHFYNYDCGACQRLEPWLIAFKARYPEIQITSYELHEMGSRQKFEEIKSEYGMDSAAVPIVFICGSVIEGVDAIETNLGPMALAVYDLEPRENSQVPVTLPLELSLD